MFHCHIIPFAVHMWLLLGFSALSWAHYLYFLIKKGFVMIGFYVCFVCFQAALHCLFTSAVCWEPLCPCLASSVTSVLRWLFLCKISNQLINHKAHSTKSWQQYSLMFSWSNHLQTVFQASTSKTFCIAVMLSTFTIFFTYRIFRRRRRRVKRKKVNRK